MRELNQMKYDDKGHVLALSLGEPANSLINLIPQHIRANRNLPKIVIIFLTRE